MANINEELIALLNTALELEHAARIQYLAHAQLVKGQGAEKIIERLEEIASDEQKHEQKYRDLIGNYLGGVPSMKMSATKPAKDLNEILVINRKDEREAIDIYKKIYQKIIASKDSLLYTFETLEHEVRHIIIEEQEHASELSVLLGE